MAQMTSKDALKLAKQYHAKGDLKQAETVYTAVLQVEPYNAEVLHNLGLIQVSRGNVDEAVNFMKKALEFDQSNAEYHNNIGEIYRQTGQMEHAQFHLSAACELKPNYSQAFSNLGLVYMQKGEVDSAKFCFAESLQLEPKNVAALVNTGNLLRGNNEHEDAVECYLAALEISPDNPTALRAIGGTYYDMGEYNQAAKYISRLTTGQPDQHRDKVNLALITLRNKDFRKGFQLYEARFNYLDTLEGSRDTLWRGTNLNDKTLYIYIEKQGLSGLGDTLMCARFLHELEKYSPAKVIFKVQPEMVSLLGANMPEYVTLTTETPESFDTHIPLFSMPLILNTRAKTIPMQTSYIKADTEKAAAMAEKMQSDRIKIGIAFQTSRHHMQYEKRSVDQEAFSSLCTDEKVQLYYISKEEPESPLHENIIDMRGDISDFADTAAIVENLDMVITADTALVHLAGAMGKKAALLIDHLHDWRWFNAKTGKQSEWYSSVTFYIKEQSAGWASVVSSIKI